MPDQRDSGWDEGAWPGHERAQRLRLSQLSLAEKVRWLEEAHQLVQALERGRSEAAARASSAADNTPDQ
jgi:hypothetical protein